MTNMLAVRCPHCGVDGTNSSGHCKREGGCGWLNCICGATWDPDKGNYFMFMGRG